MEQRFTGNSSSFVKIVSNYFTSSVEMNPAEKKRNFMVCQTDGRGFEILQESTGRVGISFPFSPNIFQIWFFNTDIMHGLP